MGFTILQKEIMTPGAAIWLCTLALLAATFLPFLHAKTWLIRDWEFPRLQLVVLCLVLLLVEIVALDFKHASSWWVLFLTILCAMYHASWIWPYSVFHRREVPAAKNADATRRLRILVSNVLMSNRNAEGFLAIARQADPDLIVVLEPDHWWHQQLSVLERDYPYRVMCPLENAYGMDLYSRLPLSDFETLFLTEPGRPSMHGMVTLRSGEQVWLHCMHPSAPSPTENPDSGERDAELLIVGRQVAGSDLPVIVTGDLNDVAWSRTTRKFKRVSGLLDPRIGRGMFNTFHTGYPFLRWPLDHLFHSHHFALVKLARLPNFGSDHFPILADLALVQPAGQGRKEKNMQALGTGRNQ